MTRLSAAILAGVVALVAIAGTAIAYEDSSRCPPTTSVEVTGVKSDGKFYELRVSATNNCRCKLCFTACSRGKSNAGCESVWIEPRKTEQVYVITPASEGAADFKWLCPDPPRVYCPVRRRR
jgi:hypothetical protein